MRTRLNPDLLPSQRAGETLGIQMDLDLDRITQPLRLARGSHRAGSSKGCAMNLISYINGDEHITDFPATSARPLAAFVQFCNDQLAGPDGYLSPKDGMVALDLGWLTVGTAEFSDSALHSGVMHSWVAELLVSPRWGVVQYVKNPAAQVVIADIAELHRRLIPDATPSIADWDSAARAARAISKTLSRAELYALRAALQSTTLVDADDWTTLDAVAGNGIRAHRLASLDFGEVSIVEITRHAVQSWRRLAGLSVRSDASVPVGVAA